MNMKPVAPSRRVFGSLFLGLSLGLFMPAITPAEAVPPPAERLEIPAPNPAIEFLKRVESANQETKTLYAEFEQTREDAMMARKIKSSGKFWYRAPNNFYAEYETEYSSRVWIDGKQAVEYIPRLKQVDIAEVEQGEDAPITQVLLGFGVKVERILRLFEVNELPSPKPDQTAIEFLSKDPGRTMEFDRIVVHFDTKSASPRTLEMEDETGPRVIELKTVRINPSIRDSVFELPKWPDDVEVNRYGRI
jgi:outer membrane lipoprotein-sorting protein